MCNILFLTVVCLILLASILETDATPKRSPNKPTSPNSTAQKEHSQKATSPKNSNITTETVGTSSPGNAEPVIAETFLDTAPKLRVFLMTYRNQFMESHYMLHRKLAELLAADTENVETVLLLVYTNKNYANQSYEEPPEFDGRLLVWTCVNPAIFGGSNWTVWNDITRAFLPNAKIARSTQLGFLTKYPDLIKQLQEFKFNVGVTETYSEDHTFSIFRALPTIKKYIGSQSTSPTIAQWKYFGYDKIVGAMPGKDLARIGDHKFASENGIKENPNHFHEINDFYIKSLEGSTKLLKQKYFDAIDQGILSKQNFADFFLHENIPEWDMKHRMDLYFTNIQPFYDFPIVEQEIENEWNNTHQNRVNFIGGITMPKGKAPNLSLDTKQIFESAKDGVVLFNFGSGVDMEDGNARAVSVKNIVVDVLKQYPQMNMIIKWGKRPQNSTVEQYIKLSENVYAKGWLEQAAILGGGLKLFISHGGLNSVNEAIKFGVPMILFPFFGDQYNCAEALAARGVAKVLDIRSETLMKDFADALDEMFNNYSAYEQRMNELSKKMNSAEPAKEFMEKFRQLRKSL